MHLHFCFVCLKVLLTAVVQDEQASNVSLHSEASFLLCNNMKTNTTNSLIIELSFKHAIYIRNSHSSVRLIICDTALNFSAIIYYH